MIAINKLKTNLLFDNLTDNEIKIIISCAKSESYQKNETIFFEKDYVSKMYLVISGGVAISKYDIDGNKSIVAHINEYDMFAESIALANPNISPYTVEAITNTQVLALDLETFKKLTKDIPSLLDNMVMILATKNTYLTFKIDCLSKHTIRERVYEILRYYYIKENSNTIKLPYNRSQLAEFLCLNRSSLTRELTKMEAEGLFTYKKGVYKLNIEKLFLKCD